MVSEITRLGVLDQTPVPEGSTGSDALQNTLDLARLTDGLGYHRYWVAEHHGGTSLAGASPEALIPAIASVAPHLRVGSGGVMLPHYSPLKVAETFSILAGLFPGRIDLGIGRAAGTDQLTTLALQRDRRHPVGDDFPSQLAELLAYQEDGLPADHPFARLADLPGAGRPEAAPHTWLLGSSPQSALWAGELGLPYAFADFINPGGASVADTYRESFRPERRLAAPQQAVAVWTVCADTDEEAQLLATSARMSMAMLRRGRLIKVPTVDTALRFLRSEGKEVEGPFGGGRRAVIGSPATVRSGLEQVAADYRAEEVLLVTIVHDHAARRRSYELVADAFGLRAPEPASAERTAVAA